MFTLCHDGSMMVELRLKQLYIKYKRTSSFNNYNIFSKNDFFQFQLSSMIIFVDLEKAAGINKMFLCSQLCWCCFAAVRQFLVMNNLYDAIIVIIAVFNKR